MKMAQQVIQHIAFYFSYCPLASLPAFNSHEAEFVLESKKPQNFTGKKMLPSLVNFFGGTVRCT